MVDLIYLLLCVFTYQQKIFLSAQVGVTLTYR